MTSLRWLSGQAEAQGWAVMAARRSALRNRRQELQVQSAQYVATVAGSTFGGGGVGAVAVSGELLVFLAASAYA